MRGNLLDHPMEVPDRGLEAERGSAEKYPFLRCLSLAV